MQRITSSRRGVTGMMVSKGFACTKMIVWFRLVKNYRIIQQFSQNSDLVVNPGYVVAMFFWGMIKGSDRGILNDIWYNQQNYSTYFHDSTNCWLITNSWVIFISPAKLVILSTGLSLRCHGEMYWIYGSGDGLNSPWLLNDFNVAWLRKMAQSEMIYGWYIYICLLEMPRCPIQVGENTLRFLSQIKDLPIINMVMGQLEDTAVLLFL